MSEEYTELLKKFYNNNEDIIKAAILSFGNDEAKEALENIQASTKKYKIRHLGVNILVNGHSKLAYEVAKILAKKYDSDSLLRIYSKISVTGCSQDYILDSAKMKENGGKLFTGDTITCTDNKVVWCSNQWIPQKVDQLIKEMCNKENIIISKEN